MDIDTRLTENGIPTMGCQNKLLYSIGTMAITLGLLLVLTWVSVAFGQRYLGLDLVAFATRERLSNRLAKQ